MSRKLTWRDTQKACYLGYISQAVVINLPSLLFVTFQRDYGVSLTELSGLIALLFVVQIIVDFVSAPIVDRVGYRACSVVGFGLCVAGLGLLSVLPRVMRSAYAGLAIAMTVASVGSGLMEVLISPITESLPMEDKGGAMSLLHSFYCWGLVGVVVLSTGYFAVFGTENWPYLPLLWALVPLTGLVAFLRVPMYQLADAGRTMTMGGILKQPVFWLLFAVMICAGASEQSMCQWASLFAEKGLGVSKTVGDLMGPCAFAAMMGCGRVFFGTGKGSKWPVERALTVCAALCVACYLTAALSPWPGMALAGCAVCGFSVGVMWPGTLTLASGRMPLGGTAMFALLALGGDVGCSAGPALVGLVADALSGGVAQAADESMRTGFLFALIFPVALMGSVAMIHKMNGKRKRSAAE